MVSAHGTSRGARRLNFLARLVMGLAVATRTLASCNVTVKMQAVPLPSARAADFREQHDTIMSQVRMPAFACSETMDEPA